MDPELPAQQIWLTDFTPEFVDIEPRPLCAFLSGSFHDWCQVNREHWRGTSRVLEQGNAVGYLDRCLHGDYRRGA